MEKDGEDHIGEGTVVRDRKWGGTCTGTVVRREGDSLFVAWPRTPNGQTGQTCPLAVEPLSDALSEEVE